MKGTHAPRLQALILVVMLFLSITPTALATNSTTANITTLCTEQQKIDTHTYYYNQLDELEKKVYDTFSEHKDDIFCNKTFSFLLGPLTSKEAYVYSVSRARQAFIMDDPEVLIWFQDVQISLDFQESDVLVSIRPKGSANHYYDLSSKELPDALKAFEEKASELIRTLNGTDAQKLYQIYDWLTSNVTYDQTLALPNTRNAYGALMSGKAICSGFAYAYKYLADLAGLEVLYVTGMFGSNSSTSEYHAWNMAKVDGNWYFIDATGGASTFKIYRKSYFLMSTTIKSYSLDTRYFTYPS